MKCEFLLEIGCEEIPPSYIDPALQQLQDIVTESLKQEHLDFDKTIHVFGTPRRLIVWLPGLESEQPETIAEFNGPPERIAFDENGSPTKAALGFAKKMGVAVDALTMKETEKGRYLSFVEKKAGQKTAILLGEKVPEWIKSLTFPKSMRWSKSPLRFARPIRWLLCLFDGQVVQCSVDSLSSDNWTRGHMRIDPAKKPVSHFDEFQGTLRSSHVIIDNNEREEIIRLKLSQQAQICGGHVVQDDTLLEIVARCSEFPDVINGSFSKAFLGLPRPVLITSMRVHQKFFAIEDDNGNLLPYFLHVIDNPEAKRDLVISGNEKVLTARLNDARFFFEEDKKITLDERLKQIEGIILHEKLGSMADKSKRLKNLVVKIAKSIYSDVTETEQLNLQRAALLCKTDLPTLMVGEFPDLQGVMGKEYAGIHGEPEDTAQAIFEHYLPRGADDIVPSTENGLSLAIADKVDTLAGYFKIGLFPSGSEDPYALRRQALGVCQIALQKKLTLDLKQILSWALEAYNSVPGDYDQTFIELKSFFIKRMETMMLNRGFIYDSINACIERSWINPLDLVHRLKALSEFRKRKDFDDLIVGFRRAARIIPDILETPLDPSHLIESGELNLYRVYEQLLPTITQNLEKGEYEFALASLAELRSPIDTFFEQIMVMCEDIKLRNNRVALLKKIVELFHLFADFRKIVISQDRDNTR